MIKTLGVRSICKDHRHILFFDLDNYTIDTVIQKLKPVQDKFNLGDIYIFKSSKCNYHAICFDKFLFKKALEIVESVNDNHIKQYVKFSAERNAFVLRFFSKGQKGIPKLTYVMKGKNIRQKSKAHLIFLSGWYGFNYDYKNIDNLWGVFIDSYSTPMSVAKVFK